MKAAIYARLSREDEGKVDGNQDSRSIENQITTLSSYALQHHIEVVKVYYDDGYSGGTLDRPALQEMLMAAKHKLFDTILIKDFSRLGRSLYQVGKLVEKTLPSLNIRLISVNDNYDSLTYKDDESVVLKNFLNDYYLKDFKKKCRKSLEHRANTKHLNYYPKYGYIYDVEGKEQIDPVASKVVKEIFELVPSLGYTETANYLNDNGVLTRSQYQTQVLKLKPLNKAPATKWNSSKVYEIITDYEYCGHIVNLIKRKEGPIVMKNVRPSIVTEEQYQIANKKRMKTQNNKQNQKDRLMFLYNSFNQRLCYVQKTTKNIYMKGNIYLDEQTVIKMLYNDSLDVLSQISKDKDKFLSILKDRINPDSKYTKESLEKKQKALDLKYSELLEKYFTGKMTENYFVNQSSVLQDEINEVKNKLEDISNVASKVALLERKYNMFLEKIKVQPRNEIELIRLMINKVVISKDLNNEYDIKIKYNFEI